VRFLPLPLLALGLALAVPAHALDDLSGAYALEGSSTNAAYRGTVTLAKQTTFQLPGRLPGDRDADLYQVEWLYENGHKDLGVGVRMGERLYVAWSLAPLVELYVAMPAPDSLAPALIPLRKSGQDRIAYGFRRDGLGKLLTLGGPPGAPAGDYAFGGIALATDGTRRGTLETEGSLSIQARPAGLVLTGKGTNRVPEPRAFAMEGAGMALKDGWFLFSWTAPGRDPNGVGDFAIDGKRLSGELYDRMRLYRAYETLTKKEPAAP
jgi:hypothetical protein